MNRLTYNLAVAAGLSCITAGVYLMSGAPSALITAGALVLALTVLGATLSGRA